jgi:hypothetical protein
MEEKEREREREHNFPKDVEYVMSTHNNLPFTVGVGWQGLKQKTLMGITKNQLDIQTTNKAQNIGMVDKRQNFL